MLMEPPQVKDFERLQVHTMVQQYDLQSHKVKSLVIFNNLKIEVSLMSSKSVHSHLNRKIVSFENVTAVWRKNSKIKIQQNF